MSVTLTDKAPRGLNKALSSSFSHAAQLGLFAPSTPFVTGRPYTLIFKDSVKSFLVVIDLFIPHTSDIPSNLFRLARLALDIPW